MKGPDTVTGVETFTFNMASYTDGGDDHLGGASGQHDAPTSTSLGAPVTASTRTAWLEP